MFPTPKAFSAFFNTFFGQRYGFHFLVQSIVFAFVHFFRDFAEHYVKLVRIGARRGNYERSSGFVYQNGVNLVHNGEIVSPARIALLARNAACIAASGRSMAGRSLNNIADIVSDIVAEIIKPNSLLVP